MSVIQQEFGMTGDGHKVSLYVLENASGMRAAVSDFGALLVKLEVPDHSGKLRDVVLGYDSVQEYEVNMPFFGAVIGPVANRTGNAKFTLHGKTYQLLANDGKNNLHSDSISGFHKRMWTAQPGDDCVTFTLDSPDGDMGFPGNKHCAVTYALTRENGLEIRYRVTSDADCPVNMTNHSYFNLMGQGQGTIESHKLQLTADYFTRADQESIPTGQILPVAGTPMDFTTMQVVGERIDSDYDQLNFAGGYDHNWALNDYGTGVRKVAVVEAPDGGVTMEVSTDLPGVQFYAGNFITPHTGKNGVLYQKRSGLCLETQFYPDSVNKPDFPSCIFGPDRPYETTTIFQFV